MRSVQEGDLTLVIWGFARNEKDIQPGLVGREFHCNFLRRLDDPEMEDLGFHHQPVFVACTVEKFGDVVFRIARNYSVHQSAVYAASGFKPVTEIFTQIPEFDVLAYAFLQFLSVQENKFARKDDETFRFVAVEMPVSPVQELRKLSGI